MDRDIAQCIKQAEAAARDILITTDKALNKNLEYPNSLWLEIEKIADDISLFPLVYSMALFATYGMNPGQVLVVGGIANDENALWAQKVVNYVGENKMSDASKLPNYIEELGDGAPGKIMALAAVCVTMLRGIPEENVIKVGESEIPW